MQNLVIIKDPFGVPTYGRPVSEHGTLYNGTSGTRETITVPDGAHICIYKSDVHIIVAHELITLPTAGNSVTGELSMDPSATDVRDVSQIYVTPLADGWFSCEFYEIIGGV